MPAAENLLESEIIIDSVAAGHVRDAAVWGRFLGVLGFIYAAIIAAAGVYAGLSIAGFASRYTGSRSRVAEAGTTALLYLAGAGIVFFMSLYLFRFARKAKAAIASGSQEEFNTALKNLKIYFRFAGIMSIIMLVFTILAIIGVMLAASYSRY